MRTKSDDSAIASEALVSYAPGATELGARTKLSGGLAKFRLIYQSRDGRLCLFEDKAGHLTSVRTSRMA